MFTRILTYTHICMSISGFNSVRMDINGPNLRGLCLFVRKDFNFSVIDISGLSHHSAEVLGISVQCSLDSPVVLLNVYRHPNSFTPFSFFRNLFSFISTYKYAILLGDFNAHHTAWDDGRQNRSGEYIYRNLETFGVVIMNDGSSTYISPPGASSSVIDLTFVTKDLASLCEVVTGTDSHGSDHLPIHITINETMATSKRFKCKIKLNKKQLGTLHCLLERESNRIEEIFAPSASLDPIAKYRTFYSILIESIESVISSRILGPRKSVGRVPIPAPWWNNKCSDAVGIRRNLCRMYKANPTLDNWIAYRREVARCRRILNREKRLGWRNLCSSFNSKTPTADIWRFIRAYKKKSLTGGCPKANDGFLSDMQNTIVDKLCPPSCLLLPAQSLTEMEMVDQQSDGVFS